MTEQVQQRFIFPNFLANEIHKLLYGRDLPIILEVRRFRGSKSIALYVGPVSREYVRQTQSTQTVQTRNTVRSPTGRLISDETTKFTTVRSKR